jgi:hypothetical protein
MDMQSLKLSLLLMLLALEHCAGALQTGSIRTSVGQTARASQAEPLQY